MVDGFQSCRARYPSGRERLAGLRRYTRSPPGSIARHSGPLADWEPRAMRQPRVALDAGIGPMPCPVLTSDRELFQLRALYHKTAIGMREVDFDRAREPLGRGERRPRIRDLFSVLICQRAESEPLAHRLLVLGMNVVRVARVDGFGQTGIGNRGRRDGLRLARFGPFVPCPPEPGCAA